MSKISRKQFLARTSLAAAGLNSLHFGKAWSRPMGANEAVRVGLVGLGWKGSGHVDSFSKLSGVRVVALCDVDKVHVEREVQKFRDRNEPVKTYGDFRDLLDDKDIDAVVISTPNHWHALMTIWACQAGKDVYVEKPVCHDIREGQRMLEAEQKYDRVIQGGTQNRSNFAFDEGVAHLREGHLGSILGIHGVRYRHRPSIGKVRGPQRIPDSVDYNLYQGPAPLTPLMRKTLHYDWHWQWATGNGDMGNNAAHTIDDIRRILGDKEPKRVMSVGGRFGYEDDGETPNTHITLMDYGDFPVYAEIRNLPHKKGVEQMDHLKGLRTGTVVFCESGYMTLGWGGAQAYSKEGKRIKAWDGSARGHAANFIEAVRSRKPNSVNCTLEMGVRAADIFHLANLSYRSGMPSIPEKVAGLFNGSKVGGEAWISMRGNLERNQINLKTEQLTLGSWMSLGKRNKRLVVQNRESEEVAQYLFQPRNYRPPFVVSGMG